MVCKTMSQPLFHLPPFGRVGVGISAIALPPFGRVGVGFPAFALPPFGRVGGVFPASELPPFGRVGVGVRSSRCGSSLSYFSFSYLYLLVHPSSSSMRMSWLYFAIRSVRESEPVLI